MADFVVGGQTYIADKMPLLPHAFHVSRKLTPIYASMRECLQSGNFEPLGKAIGGLSVEDSEYILGACLDLVKRKENGAISKIRAGGMLMFSDITLLQMYEIMFIVLKDNFASFFSDLPQIFKGMAAA